LRWLGDNAPSWVAANVKWIPIVGRWDDLRYLFGTYSVPYAVTLWVNALLQGDVLAAKWANRKDKELRYALKMREAEFRKFLAKIRKEHIVEHKMCSKVWDTIEYSKVPSVAMSRYSKAFSKNDTDRFVEYKTSLVKGEETVHADALFPHDCVRTAKSGDSDIANAQFDALPNFLKDENIVVIADTSGSMDKFITGSIRAVDVSQALALYCSAKIPEDNPFHKRFIAFCDEAKFQSWRGMSFSNAVRDRGIFDRAVGSTRIDIALDTMLGYIIKHHVKEIPTVLLIVSDMQFSNGASTRSGFTEVETCLQKWDEASYKRPKIVYWNTAGYAGSPDTINSENVALVSGFSTGILKAVLGGEDFSPKGVMLKALEKYNVENPLFGNLEI